MYNYHPNSTSIYINDERNGSGSESDSTVIVDMDDTSTENTDNETDDSDDDDDAGIEYDSIHNEDSSHFYSEKEHGKYYIGLCHLQFTPISTLWLLSTSVSACSFFRHSYDNINNYLYYYGLVRIPRCKLQIMQVQRLQDETCAVIIKTHWLRLVQRHWKKTYRKRKIMLRSRMHHTMQYYKQTHGYYHSHISRLPSITGMLSKYAKYI